MSEWTSLANQVLQHRYDLASYWSDKQQNTLQANQVLEARLATVLFPGSMIENPQGSFSPNWKVGVTLASGAKDPRMLPGIIFRPIPTSLGAQDLNIPYGQYLEDRWFRRDWSYLDLVAAGMSSAYASFLDQARALWVKILGQLAWVPNTIAVKVDRAISMGMMPRMLNTSIYEQQFGPLPEWLQSPYRQAAWNEMVSVLGQLNKDVSAANLEQLRAEAVRLQASREFWDQVASWSGADLMERKWRELQDKVFEFKQATKVGREAVARMRAMVAQNPQGFTQEQVQALDVVDGEIQANVDGIKSQTPSSILQALERDGVALGVAPVIIIAIGVSVIAAAATVVVYWAGQANETARKAMNLENDFLMQADASADAAFAQEQAYILEQERETQALYDAGEMSQADYNNRMSNLAARRERNLANLANRRAQTQVMLQTHHQNLQELQDAANSGILGRFGSILMWGTLGMGMLFFGPKLARRIKS